MCRCSVREREGRIYNKLVARARAHSQREVRRGGETVGESVPGGPREPGGEPGPERCGAEEGEFEK